MIAVTQTLSTWGGTFYVSRGLGFLYNNHLRSNRTQRGSYGQLLPRMRSNTASVPTLVFREEAGERTPRLALGVAGNAWIPASAYSIITAVIDGGLPMQRAIEAPRFLVSHDPADPLGTTGRIEIEDRFPRTIMEDLRARGHLFQKIGRKGEVRYGYASAVLVDVANKRVEGGSEPRRSHMAVAFEGGPPLTQQQPKARAAARSSYHFPPLITRSRRRRVLPLLDRFLAVRLPGPGRGVIYGAPTGAATGSARSSPEKRPCRRAMSSASRSNRSRPSRRRAVPAFDTRTVAPAGTAASVS
jgi:hypothetical protein